MEIPGSVELPGFGHMSSGRVQIPSSVKISSCVKISGCVGRAEKTTLIPFLVSDLEVIATLDNKRLVDIHSDIIFFQPQLLSFLI